MKPNEKQPRPAIDKVVDWLNERPEVLSAYLSVPVSPYEAAIAIVLEELREDGGNKMLVFQAYSWDDKDGKPDYRTPRYEVQRQQTATLQKILKIWEEAEKDSGRTGTGFYATLIDEGYIDRIEDEINRYRGEAEIHESNNKQIAEFVYGFSMDDSKSRTSNKFVRYHLSERGHLLMRRTATFSGCNSDHRLGVVDLQKMDKEPIDTLDVEVGPKHARPSDFGAHQRRRGNLAAWLLVGV
jgi:hypothetical protein